MMSDGACSAHEVKPIAKYRNPAISNPPAAINSLWKNKGSVWPASCCSRLFLRGKRIQQYNMKYNQSALDKIEKILDETGYVVRYERGNFQSGYCILEERKVVVLNKFLQLEGRINTLMDIIPQLSIVPDMLTAEARKTYEGVLAKYHEEEK